MPTPNLQATSPVQPADLDPETLTLLGAPILLDGEDVQLYEMFHRRVRQALQPTL
jgi:hypothetical protein